MNYAVCISPSPRRERVGVRGGKKSFPNEGILIRPVLDPTCTEFMLMKISAVSFGPRYAEGFCPAEFMLMQISALGYAVASEASKASQGMTKFAVLTPCREV
jgi:hypothetical protein